MKGNVLKMVPSGKDIWELLRLVTNLDLRNKLFNLCDILKNKHKMYYFSSARKHHHWKTGGWSDHTAQVIKISIDLYKEISKYDPIKDFTLDDVILVAFVHDLDKLWRYVELKEPKEDQIFEYRKDLPPYNESSKVVAECFRYGIELNDQHIEAIDHHHGGYSFDISSVYSKNTSMTKLSALIHCADILSTYMWGDHETKDNG
jgi:hypothetical protein